MKYWFSKVRGGFFVTLGYLLSPLSWWNDLVFNFPIALGVGYGLSWFNPDWLWPGTVVGYWLSNVLGMLLIQWGTGDLLLSNHKRNWQRDLWWGLGGSTVYTVVIAVVVYFHWLPLPEFLLPIQP